MNAYGARTLPHALDSHALNNPGRLYASVPKSNDLSEGFQDVTCKEMAICVNYMASTISERFGESENFETIAYIGIPDLRSVAVFLGAVKRGYKVLLPSPRNPPATNLSLMTQMSCSKLLYAAEVTLVVKAIAAINPTLDAQQIPNFKEMHNSHPEEVPYDHDFEDAKNDPIVVLHSSGSTGLPKPIIMTHATFAILDNERNLPKVPGRKNRDYSIWDLTGGGRFYTVFPYFHLAGFLSLSVNPIFTEVSSPVLGPPLMPPSGSLLKDVMKHQSLRALYLPPSIAESLLLEPDGLDLFKNLDFLCYTGAPFSSEAGKQLSSVTELCPLYGSTEAFQVPQLAPAVKADWAWMEWNPCFKVDMQPSEDETGTYELVLFADETTKYMSALNHNLPGVSEYRTRDLFKQHPEKSGLWQYYGRRDDIIVLSNGAKFNPVPMELMLPSHPALSGSLVVGAHRIQAALLVEVKADQERSGLLERLWPIVEKANKLLPSQGHIMRNKVLLSSPEKPFIRAGKGTVVRKLTERLYQPEIDALYASGDDTFIQSLPSLTKTTIEVFNFSDILGLVREIVTEGFPDMAGIADQNDLLSNGLDSIRVRILMSLLKKSLNSVKDLDDLTWLDTQTILQHTSIFGIASTIHAYLNNQGTSKDASQNPRETVMQDLVEKYSQGFIHGEQTSAKTTSGSLKGVIALIGSTGYLGPHIVASLLKLPGISAIHCLNRSVDAEERTISAVLRIHSALKKSDLEKVRFLLADMSKPKFGFEETQFDSLTSTVDSIIFNAWQPNFSLPIQAFEKPFILGLRTTIDWSASTSKQPRIVFVSSLAAVGSWPLVNTDQPMIPEAPASSNKVALNMGYGESKCVAEQILARASEITGSPVAIVRAGQIGGSSVPEASSWPRQGWLFNLIKSSKSLGLFPMNVSPIDWIPVNDFATAIAKISYSVDDGTKMQVFNLVHPETVPWHLFYQVLTETYALEATETSLPDWLDHLAQRLEATAETDQELGAFKIFDFMRSLGMGREHNMRCKTEEAERVLGKVSPLSAALIAAWLQDWNLKLSKIKEKM